MNCQNNSIIQCSDAAADEWKAKKEKKWKDDQCWREVGRECEDEKNCEKKFLKEKETSGTMMFKIVDVKNSNAKIIIKYHINDTSTISSNFTKFFF